VVVAYSKDALGEVVRALRERQGWTQEQLGRAAGYRTGAGVSISRLEGGLLRPSPERFAGIAAALGLTADELGVRAASASSTAGDQPPAHGATAESEGGARPGGAKAPPGQKELNARRQQIELETGERARIVTELGDAFNAAHDRARDAFFLRLVEIGGRVAGSPPLDPAQLGDGAEAEGDHAASDRRGAHAFASSGSSGDAADGAAGVAAGRGARGRAARVTGGTLVLAGIVAVPVGMLFAGGLAYMVKRNRRQRQEFDAQLRDAEAELAATRPGIAALQDILPRGAETLDYIATHAGHAVDRWAEQHATAPTTWASLSPAEQQRFGDFVDIADAQVAIASFDYQGVLVTRGSDRDRLIELADEVLTRSRDVVRSFV
jgi:transcriptional regulator with XRE-family HTH domain